MSGWDQTTQRADLGILHDIILGTRATGERRLDGHLGRPYAHKVAGVLCASSSGELRLDHISEMVS